MTRRLPICRADLAPSGTDRPRRAVLVGPIQQENLALQYLASAARRAGHEAHVVAYSYRSDLDRALTDALAYQPDLVGLGIAFQNNIEDYLAFMRAVRGRGFSGHLTCGGHVPTFCYRELLSDVPALDSVVRHDGEQTLVEMLDCLRSQRESEGDRRSRVAGRKRDRHGSAAPIGGESRRARAARAKQRALCCRRCHR